MGRSKPSIQSSAPPRVKVTKHVTENLSHKMNTFIKNAKQDKSDAAKMNTMQMDPPGGRRRMGRATKVATAESESSLSPVDVDSSKDGGNAGGSGGVANTANSECRRSSRKKTIKFDVRDLLNKNRKSHKIQIEARIDSNAPKSGAGPASKEELDSKQKTFIEKSAIFRRYSFSENRQPPRPPPPPVALIKSIQQCVGELEQLPLDRDIDLAAISPITRRLSRTQEILTASMMKPKQVNSLIVTKLENATTSTPATTRKGGRQKVSTVQSASPPAQLKRRGRPRKIITGSSDSTTESSNDGSDVSETAIISNPTTSRQCADGEAKSYEDSASIGREISVSPASSTKAIDLREKTDASAVTLSPSELMEPNMFVGAEEEVFTQGLSSDESTVFLRSSPKEKSNDEISLFGRSDSTETNSSDDSERRRKKIRVSVKRVTLPSALREHVDMLKTSMATPDVVEVISLNSDESLDDSKEAKSVLKFGGEISSSLKLEESSQESSKSMQTRGSSRKQTEKSLGGQATVVEGEHSDSTTIVEISCDSAETPVEGLSSATRGTTSSQLRLTQSRRVKNCRRQVEEETVQHIPLGNVDSKDRKDVQGCSEVDVTEKNVNTMQTKSSPQQTKNCVQKQLLEVSCLQIQTPEPCPKQKEKIDETTNADARQVVEERNVPTKSAACTLSPRTRSQKEVQVDTIVIVDSEDNQNDDSRKTPATRSVAQRKRKDPVERNSASPRKQKDDEECIAIAHDIDEAPEKSSPALTENSISSEQKTPGGGHRLDTQTIDSNEKLADSSSEVQRAAGKVQKSSRCSRTEKTSEEKTLPLAEEDMKDKANVKLNSSGVETVDKECTESKSSLTEESTSSRKSPPDSPQQEGNEEVPKKGSSLVTKKTKKAPKYFARVISTDQSSSSSEQSESPKSHNKKQPTDMDKSKEDTSSICSESSSIESSSSTSSLSSTTASSKSSSTSSTSSTPSTSSISSTSSTSSSSLSGVHGRTTRSRRSQRIVLDSVEGNSKHPKNSTAVTKEEQQFTEPESENSEHSLRRGKVKTTTNMPPKDRVKHVQRRRSVRANRFLLDEESNETSSESSETFSSRRTTRAARSMNRSEVPSTIKKTSRSVDCMRGPKVPIKAEVSPLMKDSNESKAISISPQKQQQKSAENVVRDSVKVSGDQLRLESQSKKKPGRFVPLKGKSPERTSFDDTSYSPSTMRETRARRKTISSASELEELMHHRISKGAERKKQIKDNKPLPLEEMKQKLKEKKSVMQDEQKSKVVEENETVGAKTETGVNSLREVSSSVYVEKPEVVSAAEEIKKGAKSSKDQSSEGTSEVDQKASDADSEESKSSTKVACALRSPKCKVTVKNVDMEALKLSSKPKRLVNEQEPLSKTENEAKVVEAATDSEPKSEENKTDRILNAICSEGDDPKSTTTLQSIPELSSEISKAQPTESSTSAEGEEATKQQTTQIPETTSTIVSTPVDPIKLEEEVKVAEKFFDKVGAPESVQETEKEESQKEQVKDETCTLLTEDKKQEDLKQNSFSTPTENLQTTGEDEICVSEPTGMTLMNTSDPTFVSSFQLNDAGITEQNLDSSSREMHNHVEESILMDSEPMDDSVSGEQPEIDNETQVPQDTDGAPNKKQLSLPKKKKTGQQESQNLTDDEQKKKKEHPDESNNELATAESSNSNDSLKPGEPKTDTKTTACRLLDSSFIESLEKSLMRPATAKKLQKTKDKPQTTSATLKDKEDSKKCKKNQGDDLKKVDSIASPKPKKKQKDLVKAEKKAEIEPPNKRKVVAKNKSVDVCKPFEPNDSKIGVPENITPDVPQAMIVENAASEVETQQPKEVPANPLKPMKSKGETKFYPDEHRKEDNLNATTEECPLGGGLKENSPDLVPDPLKDIEKFIEDGVNLLKRGYKLDESEKSAGNNEVIKPDETTMSKKCKLDEISDDKKQTHPEDDNSNSNSNSEHSTLTSTPSSDVETPNGIRRSHRIKNNSKSAKCLVGRGLVRDRERFSMKDDEKTVYSIDDQKMDLAEVEAKNSKFLKDMEERLSNFRVIRENEYKCERVISKEAKRMLCDCFLTAEEEERGELGCGEDCLNRLLMIECGSDCTVKERCTNRRFTKFLYSPCRVFRTEKKGFGIMADIEILPGEFIMEYVGEVIDGDEFERRRNAYSQDKNKHYYFMALRSDAIIDATAKGNISRFINHSCDPNAETQKWTVNGELRIGFFSRKSIMPGEEITFDYQYQRYGKEAQKCYCESANCRGWIGEEPSSEEEEEEEEIDEDEGETESEDEEDQETVAMPTIPVTGPSITSESEQLVSEVPVVGKDVENAELLPVFTQVTVEAAKPPNEIQPKKKKEKRRQLERKEEKIKRRETKQFLEDPDIEDEVRFLVKCGLRNQADTLRLSRLIVRAKLLGTRLNLLQILRAGELPCRRLFLDYHGLRLLHGWMSEVIDTQDTEKSMEIRMALLSVLECLPIPNKTMLTDSKVYQTVRDWSNNKESHSPSDESPKDSTTVSLSSPVRSEDSSTELQKLAAKLVNTWDNLPEVFRIPKRERIEQMKEHEREADRQYKGFGQSVSASDARRNRDRFIRNGPNSSRFKWSRSEKDKERERMGDRRRYLVNGGSGKDGVDKTQGVADSHLSKEQRRELFAAKVARDEAEKRLAEERREFDIKCRFFGLDPKRLRPENMPFCVNPSTGQWYSTDKKPISTPPSYAHVQVPVKPKSTNPADYQLPIMDLPPLWKFAISPKGKIYYYHVKIRIPQWEPPIKILPLAGQKNTHVKASESDSSNAECADSSDDDIDIIKGLDPVKLQAYIEKKIEDRRLQRYNRLVEEKPISPRKEEDRIYNQMEVRKYKENKEKIRKRKEEIRRRRDTTVKITTSIETNQPEPTAEADEVAVDAIPIQDYLLSSDEEDKIKEECNNSPLIDKIVQGDKIVDELDALQCKRPLKRALPIREKYEHKKRKVDKNKESTKSTKRSKDGEGSSSSSSSKYRKIREKFRCEIAGIIVQHLRPYRKETCFSGRILTDNDFNHLARKLTHFVMVKELKYCESIGQTLVVTESVKNKSREFIKKYMAKYGGVYVRPKNDPEFKEIPFL